LILRELLQIADIDYVAFSPRGKSVEDMSRKEIIKALRNKIPVEYVREQFNVGEGDSRGETKGQRSAPTPPAVEPPAAPVPVEEEPVTEPEPAPGKTGSLRDHLERVSGRKIARFLSDDFSVLAEVRADEMERTLEGLAGPVLGLVVDRAVDQRTLDCLVARGLEFVAARDFSGVIKRPLSIRLIKLP
jgi:hypothetical protein